MDDWRRSLKAAQPNDTPKAALEAWLSEVQKWRCVCLKKNKKKFMVKVKSFIDCHWQCLPHVLGAKFGCFRTKLRWFCCRLQLSRLYKNYFQRCHRLPSCSIRFWPTQHFGASLSGRILPSSVASCLWSRGQSYGSTMVCPCRGWTRDWWPCDWKYWKHWEWHKNERHKAAESFQEGGGGYAAWRRLPAAELFTA